VEDPKQPALHISYLNLRINLNTLRQMTYTFDKRDLWIRFNKGF